MRISSSPITTKISNAADMILSSSQIIALTGAGSSTPSGIPDFRSPDSGLWNQHSPMEVASLTRFRRQPEVFFKWLRPLARQLVYAHPNPSHKALAELENAGHLKATITQNIDGLHQRAGSKAVIEVHGSLKTLSCIGCYRQVPSDGFIEVYIEEGQIPYCPNCNNILKPDVVLFEEQLPIKPWLKALDAANTCDLMLVSGSSLVVMPVAGLPQRVIDRQAKIIIINFTPTYIDDYADIVIYGDVAEILPAICAEVLDV